MPISAPALPNATLVLATDGTVIDLLPASHPNLAGRQTETINGVLCPGFVNAHCHLELSHLSGLIDEDTGLPAFVKSVVGMRQAQHEMIAEAMQIADAQMLATGTVAVGDISNTAASVGIKQKSGIAYHTFVEVFAFSQARANAAFIEAKRVLSSFETNGLACSLVPHAPYSLHPALAKLLSEAWQTSTGPISIHNQETESEDEMFLTGRGQLVETFAGMGIDMGQFPATGLPSLRSYLGLMPTHRPTLLVHNTFTAVQEMRWALANHKNLTFCTCPRANLYIENTLPNYKMWLNEAANVAIGTDSLASNHDLLLINELKVVQNELPNLNLNQLLHFTTMGGAKALGMDSLLGSFERGKKPGVVAIENTVLTDGKPQLSNNSKSRLVQR